MDDIIIERIEAIEIRPTDTIILKCKREVSTAAHQRMREFMESKFPANEIIIMGDDVEMEVYREEGKDEN